MRYSMPLIGYWSELLPLACKRTQMGEADRAGRFFLASSPHARLCSSSCRAKAGRAVRAAHWASLHHCTPNVAISRHDTPAGCKHVSVRAHSSSTQTPAPAATNDEWASGFQASCFARSSRVPVQMSSTTVTTRQTSTLSC
jgi:hypothetical protein